MPIGSRSRFSGGAPGFGNTRAVSTSTGTPARPMIRNAHCHDRASARKPPSTGPTTNDTPYTALRTPWNLPRSFGRKRSATDT